MTIKHEYADQNLAEKLLQYVDIFKLRFFLKVKSSGSLPVVKGSTLRGVIAHTFYDRHCQCKLVDGKHENDCAYAILFEHSYSERAAHWLKEDSWMEQLLQKQDAKPIVFDASAQLKTQYTQNELFYFDISLFGDSILCLEPLIDSISVAGQFGFGVQKVKMELLQVNTVNEYDLPSRLVYSAKEGQIDFPAIERVDLQAQYSSCENMTNGIKVELKTPLRFKLNGQFSTELTGEAFAKMIVNRVLSICALYHEVSYFDDKVIEELFKDLKGFTLEEKKLEYYSLERYSNRKQYKMNMSGIVGCFSVNEHIERLLPWLIIAQYVHIGKNTLFGLGKLSLEVK